MAVQGPGHIARHLHVSAAAPDLLQTQSKIPAHGTINGGQQLSVTVVSPEELVDAQKNPNAHRDLIVRVGGYSDYFVNLPKDLQDNVIARTIYQI